MKIHGVFVFDGGVELFYDAFETREEALKSADYLKTLPPQILRFKDVFVHEMEVSKEFKPYFSEEEVESAWHIDDVANDYASREL